MLPGTVSGYPYPLRNQVRVTANRTLTARELNSLIVIDSTAGPVAITLPSARSIQGGGFFQILALTGDLNPVTIALQPGDTYNQGLVVPIVLNSAGEQSIVLGRPPDVPNSWLIPQGVGAPVGSGSFDVEFGVLNLNGAGVDPRYLWPGSSASASMGRISARPLAATSRLRAILVRQNVPLLVGVQTNIYQVLINGIVVAATPPVLVTAPGVLVVGLNVPGIQNDSIAFRADRSANHATLVDVIATTLWENS